MPYIAPKRRALYDDNIAALAATLSKETPGGDLNYIVTRLFVDWLEKRGLGYAAIAEAVGVLETAKQEFYRRVAAPYEDRKIAENGDVYD
jgi:hypothetical protein